MPKTNKPPKPDRLSKEEFLQYWKQLPPNQKIKPVPVAYKHKGSTYAEDGIRITGSRKFVDSVISHLQDMLQYENGRTRLHVNYTQSTDKEARYPIDSWVCYIQVHERGREAQIVNAIFGMGSK